MTRSKQRHHTKKAGKGKRKRFVLGTASDRMLKIRYSLPETTEKEKRRIIAELRRRREAEFNGKRRPREADARSVSNAYGRILRGPPVSGGRGG